MSGHKVAHDEDSSNLGEAVNISVHRGQNLLVVAVVTLHKNSFSVDRVVSRTVDLLPVYVSSVERHVVLNTALVVAAILVRIRSARGVIRAKSVKRCA